ncbi:hypothetical protein BJY00DRAFT_295672 [Aspergillus carlsbadensis]|nr:hypothetical protein BJY00DRAFT_295672 [Aspergillus carlsbadensis]
MLTVQESSDCSVVTPQHCACPSNSACCHIIRSPALVISGMTMGLERIVPRIPWSNSKEFCSSLGRSPLPSISVLTTESQLGWLNDLVEIKMTSRVEIWIAVEGGFLFSVVAVLCFVFPQVLQGTSYLRTEEYRGTFQGSTASPVLQCCV